MSRLLLVLCCFLPVLGLSQSFVDFNTWIQEGDTTAGQWTVGATSDTAIQLINSAFGDGPNHFVSPDSMINVLVSGYVRIDSTIPILDDDWLGLMAGYRTPDSSTAISDYEYLLLDWKRRDQGSFNPPGTMMEGFSLVQVDQVASSTFSFVNTFGLHNNVPGQFDVLATDYGANKGWEYDSIYFMQLGYFADRVFWILDGDTIFDDHDSFEAGRVGLYTFSQGDVYFFNFTIDFTANLQVSNTVGCVGDSISFTSVDTSIATLAQSQIASWYWDFGDGNFSLLPNPKHSYANQGNYQVVLVISDSIGQADTAYTSIQVNSGVSPIADFSAQQFCANTATSFTDSSIANSGSIDSWSWDFGDGNTDTLQNPQHLFAQAGQYTVSLTVENTNGCQSTASSTLTINPNPQVSITATGSFCEGAAVTYVADSTQDSTTLSSFFWDFGDGTTGTLDSVTHSYGAAGTYTVSLLTTSSAGCIDSVSTQRGINPLPQPAFSTAAVCDGTNASFTDNSTISTGSITQWDWNFGDGGVSSQTNPTHLYGQAGIYSVTLVTTSDSGCVDSVSALQIVNPNPQAGFSFVGICIGGPTVFNDTSSLGSGSITQWNWDFGSGNTSTAQNPTATLSNVGQNTVTLVVTSDSGCVDSVSSSLTIFPEPQISLLTQSACIGDSFIFDDSIALSLGSLASVTYDFGDGSAAFFGQDPMHAYQSSGPFMVTIVAQSVEGCGDTLITTVSPVAQPQAAFTALDSLCLGDSIFFLDQSTSSGSYTINWDFGDGTTDSTTNPTHVYGQTGAYSVTLQVASDSGCVDSASQVVQVSAFPSVTLNAPHACLNDSTAFADVVTVTGGSVQSITYDFGDGNTATGSSPTHLYADTGTYSVMMTAISDAGCITLSPIEADVFPQVVAAFTADSVCAGAGVQFTNQTTGTIPFTSYQWTFGDGNSATVTSPNHTYATGGTYSAQLVASNLQACADSVSQQIVVHPTPTAAVGTLDSIQCAELPINLTSMSTIASGAITSYFWDFDNGQTDTGSSVSVFYDTTGTYTYQHAVVSDLGCVDTFAQTITIVNCMSVEEQQETAISMAFYPNPASASITIQLEDVATPSWQLRLFNATGQQLISRNWQFAGRSATLTIPIQELPNGLYLLVVESAEGRMSKPLMVTR